MPYFNIIIIMITITIENELRPLIKKEERNKKKLYTTEVNILKILLSISQPSN